MAKCIKYLLCTNRKGHRETIPQKDKVGNNRNIQDFDLETPQERT